MITGYIKGQELRIIQPITASDTIDMLSARFVFQTVEWANLVKIAYLTHGDNTYAYLLDDNGIIDNLNLAAGVWGVCVWGFDIDAIAYIGDLPDSAAPRLTSTVAQITVVPTGKTGNDPIEIEPPSLGEQILAAAEAAKTIALNVADAAERGDFNGRDGVDGKDGAPGKDGINGKNGAKGADGYTPIKGVDYFDGKDGKDGAPGKDGVDGKDYVLTEADKTEIADKVEIPHASTTEYGTVLVGTGLQVGTVTGKLSVADSTSAAVDSRVSYRAITAAGIDYAVKAAMCDGKGAAWSAEDQAAAQARLGLISSEGVSF